jgi:hypothetical protein
MFNAAVKVVDVIVSLPVGYAVAYGVEHPCPKNLQLVTAQLVVSALSMKLTQVPTAPTFDI